MSDAQTWRARLAAAQGDEARLRALANELAAVPDAGPLRMKAIDALRKLRAEPHPLGAAAERLGLPRPDGRPLHRYRVGEARLDRLRAHLVAKLVAPPWSTATAAAFVLWVADWFRTAHKGGPQRWEDVGAALGAPITGNDGRTLTKVGLDAWGLEPVTVPKADGARYTEWLASLGVQGGFPVAAIAGGAAWPRRYLESVVSDLLGSTERTFDLALDLCARADGLVPTTWRSLEMRAVCAELALVVVALRERVEREGAEREGDPSLGWSERLDRLDPTWEDSLPLRLDEAGRALIDTLFQTRRTADGTGLRMTRRLEREGDGWRATAELSLSGPWHDSSGRLREHAGARPFLVAVGALATALPGRLAYLLHERDDAWRIEAMRPPGAFTLPFEQGIELDVTVSARRVGPSLHVPGGTPVRPNIRLFEASGPEDATGEPTGLTLLGQGSGAYRADPVFIDVPADWSIEAPEGQVSSAGPAVGPTRALWRARGIVRLRSPEGDRYLVRTAQTSDQCDNLHVLATALPGVELADALPAWRAPLSFRVREGASERVPTGREVGWRPSDERVWRQGPVSVVGHVQIAWLDPVTGHVRDRVDGYVLPADCGVEQTRRGVSTRILLHGWPHAATLDGAPPDGEGAWTIRTDRPVRALRDLTLSLPDGREPMRLIVPLNATRAWLTKPDGTPIERAQPLCLADLPGIVAHVPGPTLLNAELRRAGRSPQWASWRIESSRSLAFLEDELAAMIRPYGIDQPVRLSFHDGHDEWWTVREHAFTLDRLAERLVPSSGVIGKDVRLCGRAFAAPDQEIDLGSYRGAANGLGHQSLTVPPLGGEWLLYLRDGPRVITRPRAILGGHGPEPTARHRIGQAMARPVGEAVVAIRELFEAAAGDPGGPLMTEIALALIELIVSLDGLPPRTFSSLFDALPRGGALAPLALFHCATADLDAVIGLFDGLPFSWSLVSVDAWRAAHAAQMALGAGQEWFDAVVRDRIDAIAARLPTIAGLLDPRLAVDWDDVVAHLRDQTADSVDLEMAQPNPFRTPALTPFLPTTTYHETLVRILDAPVAAARAALGQVALDEDQVLAVRSIERAHPRLFAKAYGATIWRRET